MNELWILIFVALFATNSLDKAEAVKVKLEPKTFDEIFGEGWGDKGEAEDLKTPAPTNFGQNVHHQIDGQNTQIGQIEPNSTDQNPHLTESDHSGQFEPKSTDQNPPLTESDHSGQFEPKSTDQNPSLTESDRSDKAKKTQKVYSKKEERKHLVKKFDQRKAELKRAGFKDSYPNQIDETVAKELGISDTTIYRWKSELGQTKPNHLYAHSEQKELMKRYYKIKDQNPKISVGDIAKILKIGPSTLYKWKKHFEQPQLHPKNGQRFDNEIIDTSTFSKIMSRSYNLRP